MDGDTSPSPISLRAAGAAAAGDRITETLAPWEAEGGLPSLGQLGLDPARAYLVLAWLPSATPLDMRGPDALRSGMIHTFLSSLLPRPWAGLGTCSLGHFLLGWQCGGLGGVASLTGETAGQGARMAFDGWGLTPLLSVFDDGRLETLAEVAALRDPAIATGHAAVIAAEIAPQGLCALRRELSALVTDPARPLHNYGLFLSPAARQGAGCISLGLHLAAQAGVMPGLAATIRRDLPIHPGLLGEGAHLPPGVTPWIPPGSLPEGAGRLPLGKLMFTHWDHGAPVAHVAVPDGEALLVALSAPRAPLAPADDWRLVRASGYDDPLSRAAADLVRDWADGYPQHRLADPQGVSALVLER